MFQKKENLLGNKLKTNKMLIPKNNKEIKKKKKLENSQSKHIIKLDNAITSIKPTMSDIIQAPSEKKIIQKPTKQQNNFLSKRKKMALILFIVIVLILIGIVAFLFWQKQRPVQNLNISNENHQNKKENTEKEKNDAEEKIEKDMADKETAEEVEILLPNEAKQIIQEKSNLAIQALKNKDLNSLSQLMAENEELVFSPYANFNQQNQSFSQSEVPNLLTNQTRYNWGNYNGISTGAIQLIFADYWKDFIYDQDFAQAEKITYNQNSGSGNIKNNALSFFPNSIVVEYHFSGFDEEFDGMDWQSLRLIFIPIDEQWYLKAISHDEWTI
jgi:cytoskeletal protein RodZ